MKRENLEARYPGMLDVLGCLPDADVAVKYGLSRQRVHQIRGELSIPACVTPFTMTPEQVALLGTTTDAALAREWGVSQAVVGYYRNQRGIPVWSVILEHEKLLEPYRDQIGEVSDPKVAAMVGVEPRVVYEYRKRHGIKTKVLAPTHEDFTPLDREVIAEMYHEGRSDKEIAEALGTSPGVVCQIRTAELDLLRGEAPVRSTAEERAAIVQAWEDSHGNYAETARRTGRSATFVKKVVQQHLCPDLREKP